MIIIKIRDFFKYIVLFLVIIIFIIYINKFDDNDFTSKTLTVAKNDDNFNKNYYYHYLEIDYVNDNDFVEKINRLIDLGYTTEEINLIYDNLDEDNIDILIASKYDSDIKNYFSLNYFVDDNIGRYISFKYNNDKFSYSPFKDTINKNLNYEDIVTYVNIGLDNAYYSSDFFISKEDSNKIDVLVNKYNKLEENFIPNDLELIDSKYSLEGQMLKSEANLMFNKMCEDALILGYKIYAGSAYRSYSYQENLYNKYVLSDSFYNAETYSARAGYSEHQTGLAVDILNKNWNYLEADDEEYVWLINNSYIYGFVLRYPKDKELITGYIYEPWHFRYLGKSIAKFLYENNISYEEYIGKKTN